MVKGSDMKVRKDEELKESQSSTRKTTDTTSNDEGPRRSRRIREKNKRVVIGGEQADKPPTWYKEAMKEKSVGMWRV